MSEKNVQDDNAGKSDDENQTSNAPEYLNAALRRMIIKKKVETLPAVMQKRICVLKNIQLEQLNLEAEFYNEVYQLEKKYHEKFQPLFDKRKDIVSGTVDPPTEVALWKSEDDEIEITDRMMKEMSVKLRNDGKPPYEEDVKGVPDFWLTIFRNTEMLSEMVQEHDEPALKKLKDIRITYGDDKMHSYTLEFHFDKNEYFSNKVLTKEYFLRTSVDQDHPFAFEGPEIYKCTGCDINWETGMNLTVKTIRKKQKHKERGAVRTITKQVANDSFFNYFNPLEIPDDKDKLDEESHDICNTDYEIGHFLRARIIPKAVLYYTGDIVTDDEDDYFDEEGEEEEEEGDSEEEHEYVSGGKKKPKPNDCPNQ